MKRNRRQKPSSLMLPYGLLEIVQGMQARLKAAGFGAITTEILPAPEFYFAEDYHQQYLAKNPSGYCGIGGTGVTCPIGLDA